MILRARPTKQFDRDVLDVYRYIAADNPDAAERVFEAIEQCVKLLSVNPRIGRLWHTDNRLLEGYRVCPVLPYRNYLVFYRIEGRDLVVCRLVHGARDLERIVEEIDLDIEEQE